MDCDVNNRSRRTRHRRVVLFTLLTLTLSLAVYRIGFYVPRPGIDRTKLAAHMLTGSSGADTQAAELFAMFTGGDLTEQFTDPRADEVSRP